MIQYRDYQSQLVDGIYDSWQKGARNTLGVMPTGAGKTVVFSGITSNTREPSIAIAHRQELVSQMSIALARCDVPHRIIAQEKTINRIIKMHVRECGVCYYNAAEPHAVAGVDTLLSWGDRLSKWLPRVGLWVVDEAHHLLRANKWGEAIGMFPNARGLGVTATPIRADGRGLGNHSDGFFDDMVVGPTMRELINDGWLTDYRLFAPQSDIELSDSDVTASGDYSKVKLKNAVRKSRIVGDVVEHYQRIAPGKRTVVFASDTETAGDMAVRFNSVGVRSEVVTAKTLDASRAEIMERFKQGDVTVLINVDLFGEGFDLPAIEVVIMARPTESFALYAQQFGRALRLMLDGGAPGTREGRLAAIAASSKPKAIIIDHVGNVVRHGLPDTSREWSLDAREKHSRQMADDVIPLTSCLNVECLAVYERIHPTCPYCGSKPTPVSRSAPEFVDGDLTELDPAILAQLRGEVDRVDMLPADYRSELQRKGCPTAGEHANVKRHVERQDAQGALRASMAWWAGYHSARGRSDSESYRRFYHKFGIDVLSAQALGYNDALRLAERINNELIKGVE